LWSRGGGLRNSLWKLHDGPRQLGLFDFGRPRRAVELRRPGFNCRTGRLARGGFHAGFDE
jgi:hypothetical protein